MTVVVTAYAMRAKARLRASNSRLLCSRSADTSLPETLVTIGEALFDMKRALQLDAQAAVSVLYGADFDPGIPPERLQHIADVTRWLGYQRPRDLHDTPSPPSEAESQKHLVLKKLPPSACATLDGELSDVHR